MKRRISLILALAMLCSLLPGLGVSVRGAEASGTYTFDTYVSDVPENWNPMFADNMVRSHIQTPLVDISIKDSRKGEFQWIFLAAESVTDVTNQVSGAAGSVFEIALNPDLCWEDGTPINADSYIWSMQQILDPDMRYPAAQTYYEGATAVAGAEAYYFSGKEVLLDNYLNGIIQSEYDLVLGGDGNYYTPDGLRIIISLYHTLEYLYDSLDGYVSAYADQYFDVEAYEQLRAMTDENGEVSLNPTTLKLLQDTISNNPNWGETPDMFIHYIFCCQPYPKVDWSVVGLEKVNAYTLRYTCTSYSTRFEFLLFLADSNWLIHQKTYEACKNSGTYGTSVNTTKSYGPYKLQSVDSEQIVLVRNEKYFEYTKDAKGNLTSTPAFKVDGSYVPQWQMDTIVVHMVQSLYEAEQLLLAGELDTCELATDKAAAYVNSPALYQKIDGAVFSLFLNANLETLQNMDAYYGSTNSVVLSNYNFRKAILLSIDRFGVDMGGQLRAPALGLISESSYYAAENNPASVYRKSDAAMRAICGLYDVAYGPGTSYATLEEAYESIDGYDLEKARELMAQACKELVAAGLYTRGEPIVLTYALAANSDYMEKVLKGLGDIFNKAAKGSGFGTISVEGRLAGANWANEVQQGMSAMVLGGWNSSTLDPFTALDMYLNPSRTFTPLNMDLSRENLTLNISGKDYTMTWQNWGQVISGGWVDSVDMEFFYHNLEALAKLEEAYLEKLFAIPVFSSVTNYLLSYQVDYYTNEYNSMYGFGDTRLMHFRYTDEAWDAYVASGNLDYTKDPCQNGHDYQDGSCTRCGAEDPDYVAVVANGWSGATQWTLTDDGTLTVYGTGNMKNYGYNGGQPWLNKGVDITSVVIEEGVSAIGTGAFRNLTTLESVTLPDKGLTKIGEAAFYGCTSLKEIEIPETIYTVWLYTFKNCTALEEVKLPKSLIKVDQGAFENCTSLPYIYFPTNVEIIGSWSFKGCTGLVEADMTWTDATKIREGAFKNCSSLTTIHLPVNIQTLGDSCFYGIGATSLTVPDTVTSIEAWCFARAYSLKNIYFEGNAPTIGQGAFNKITLTAYYPKGNTTWTSAVKQNYGGTVTWTAQ